MRMFQLSFPAIAAAAIASFGVLLVSCTPPPPVPPPRFTPNPPYPPVPVDPNNPGAANPGGPQLPPTGLPQPPSRPGDYPTAQPTGRPGEVISPYEPYEVIDVSEFRPGQLARDPHTEKIFRVP
jgi:hypothetical protein